MFTKALLLLILIPINAFAVAKIVDADIATNAAIQFTKMQSETANAVCTFNGSGYIGAGVASGTAGNVLYDNGSAWVSQAFPGVLTLGAFGSAPNNNAGTISGTVLTLQPADATHPGGISTTTQTIPGDKTLAGNTTFSGNITYTSTVNSSLSGANARIPSHTTSSMYFTNVGLTSIGSADNGGVSNGHRLSICNNTGATITVTNNYGGAAAGEAIFSGTGADYIMVNKGCVLLEYSTTGNGWEMLDGGVVNLAGAGVTGVLPIANGGTNQNAFTTGYAAYYDGTRLNGNAGFIQTDGTHIGYGGAYNASYTHYITGNFYYTANGQNAYNGTASTPAMLYAGSPYAAGTATTNKPELLLEDTGNTSTGWSTGGTYLGINGKSTFTGNLLDLQKNGARQLTVANGGKFIYKMPTNNADIFCLEASAATTQYCMGMNGNDLFWDQSTNVFMTVHSGWISWGLAGNTPLYSADFNQSATSTNVATDLVRNSATYNLPILMSRNTSGTANDYSGYTFAGSSTASTAVDAAILAIHEVNTNGSETAHLSHYIRNAGGTLTDRLTIAKTGQLTASYYGAGVGVFDASGVLSSVAPGTSGNVLTSNGTTWVSSTPAAGGGTLNAKFELNGAVVPYVAIGGHVQTTTQTLSAVNIGLLNSGTSGSTVIQVNQYRSGALQGSATASIAASSGNPAASVGASLSGSLSLLSGDLITVDVNSVATGASDLTVEY